MSDSGKQGSAWKRGLSGFASLNLNSLRILISKGAGPATEYVTLAHRLYKGYGLPAHWSTLPWRTDMTVPKLPVQELFPEIDFSHSPELIHPFPRGLSTSPHELMMLAHVVRFLKPKRVIEFGTAEGRTTLNIALHLPPDGEVVTLDFPPIPGKNEVGFFYWDQPLKSKINQVYSGVDTWDSKPYRASAQVVFCDACDQPEGLAAETAQAFLVVQPGGVIFRHDYGTAEGPTLFWNELSKELPVRHLEGTALLCLRVNTPEVYETMQKMVASGRFGKFE
jgi:hypothetical protein